MRDTSKFLCRILSLEYAYQRDNSRSPHIMGISSPPWEQRDYPLQLNDFKFDDEDIYEILIDMNLVSDISLEECLHDLETDGCIKTLHPTNKSHSTEKYVLTDLGLKTGLPEDFPYTVKDMMSYYSILGAVGFSLTILGFIGGPFAIASLLDGIIHWHSIIGKIINIWQANISTPISSLLSYPFELLHLPSLPVWVADYLALGIIFTQSDIRGYKILKASNPFMMLHTRYTSSSMIYTTLLWPRMLYRNIYHGIRVSYKLKANIHDLSIVDKYRHNIHSTIGALSYSTIPIILFILICIANGIIGA